MRNRFSYGLFLVCISTLMIGATSAVSQLSGNFGLDTIVRRIPTTLSGEVKLDTPSEFAVLQFGIRSALDLTLDCGWATAGVDAAVNMAGPEHLVVTTTLDVSHVNAYGVAFGDISLFPELWFAVPFESVTDVNNLPNAVVIPPADPLFVTARLTTTCTLAGFNIKHVVMFQDVNFPSPGSAFDPLYYPVQSQSFQMGSLLYVSWRTQMGFSIRSTTGLSASQAATSIKGHSATGRADPESWFEQLSISGIRLADIEMGTFVFQQPQVGFSFIMSSSLQTASASASFSARLFDRATVSTSLTLSPLPRALGAINLSFAMEPFRFSFGIDTFAVNSISASTGSSLNLGNMSGSWGISLTGIERGLSGFSMRLSVAQGVLSAGTSVSYTRRDDRLGFASLATTMTFRLTPGTITARATFGRYGLTRASVSIGVRF